ncbi:6-pyruvoyl trahydropterin synthase family protein [Porphyromonas circumdentaria]|uniref:6-carboxy-5,6,7,8-tetrahydropterin synthase n=1 Tax=Porphyromonas circumdentaria TaxID=29524 RepID=A0A1T4Q320_9PORP|nr:6-carboxytetrahydropterin synthase [Porphyromonas circumdentaria]MBB6276601.1 6-pyruvoyltetrahydropterin/6-carboxytetrahydropterin synthase [Porphyromonas circumdentaria]MDO4723114.1 6-carboxytetrahydropterin synthase [Porphyromonas circumdentaria]SJZ97891.1 6-pyruvoyltetrahydropterin/6-carboxytetrahydropterin synthase [Porphyromonas circumdentaria]
MEQKNNYQPLLTVERYHDISMGHRVVGHEHKCRHLHGHNYRIHFVCSAQQVDSLGRIIDFGIIKSLLCEWLEEHWDHRMMLWNEDPLLTSLLEVVPDDIVIVPFNPTAEAIATYLVEEVAPQLLQGTEVSLIACRVEETAKCSASYHRLPQL